MAKSNYLPAFLCIAFIWFCSHTVSNTVEQSAQTSAIQYYSYAQSKASTAKRILLQSIYSTEIGVREQSNRNDGDRVEEYLAYTANRKGEPWCASFVCWALGKAGISNPRSAWSPDLLPPSRYVWKNSWQKSKRLPQSGDVFGIWFSDKGRVAHCGFIDAWSNSYVFTVEGNTNEIGSREGDGVYRKRRLKSSLYAVADWVSGREENNGI